MSHDQKSFCLAFKGSLVSVYRSKIASKVETLALLIVSQRNYDIVKIYVHLLAISLFLFYIIYFIQLDLGHYFDTRTKKNSI